MKITMTAIVERQRARFYIQKKQKKCETIKKKARQFPLRFIYKRPYILRYWIFHEIFELSIYIQKASNFGLRDVFIFKKLDTSQKPI